MGESCKPGFYQTHQFQAVDLRKKRLKNKKPDQPVFLFSTKNGIIIYLHFGSGPGCYLVTIPNLPIEHRYAYAQH